MLKNFAVSFFLVLKKNSYRVLGVSGLNEIINILAKMSINFASTLAPLALVWVVNGFQPFFVFFYGVLLTIFLPKIGFERLEKKIIFQKLLAIIVMFIGTYLINR